MQTWHSLLRPSFQGFAFEAWREVPEFSVPVGAETSVPKIETRVRSRPKNNFRRGGFPILSGRNVLRQQGRTLGAVSKVGELLPH